VLDSVLNEIPTLTLDEDSPVGLRMMQLRSKCSPPHNLGIFGRPKHTRI
jgi:hypothetical protein